MEKIKIAIGQRPHYHNGQLLLEGDFLAEQKYHIDARRRHNVHLHGGGSWGVVYGLTVARASDTSLTIHPDIAINALGYEIFLERTQHVSVAEFGPNDLLHIVLSYEDDTGSESRADVSRIRCDFYTLITVSKITEDSTGLTIARVQLDGQGRLDDQAIDYSHTKYVRSVAPGSITPNELHANLRRGWLRLPFRPVPLVNVPQWEEEIPLNAPQGAAEIPPAFRVGTTEVLTPSPEEANETDKGAAGTMAIPIPPSVTQVTRLRIAGARNEGEIRLQLIRGGWDWNRKEHIHKVIVRKIITGAPFMETFHIDDTALDPEYQTLSLWLWGTRRTSISLIATEFVY